MLVKDHSCTSREPRQRHLEADLVVTGGGMAGCCAAIAAARNGLRVILVQDRPVLGGNASSEVRLWILGATSHMGNNNRWAREGGIIDEILVENLYRNKEGNPLILDTILLEKVTAEPGITLLLNTAVHALEKSAPDHICALKAFCSQNSTAYLLEAPLFCDASGDGIVSFLAGAAFRMGAESREEFDEGLAPDSGYGELLGHSIYFYSKRVDQPVRFVAPGFALKDITQIPRYKMLNPQDDGCRLWWIEYGGRNDTVHDSELIKWELWRVVYGVWDYIKNSGNFPDVDNLTLEWVGTIPGKRESRRFEGLYMLTQKDIITQQVFADAVAYGGWALDLHPADGIYSTLPSCNQWHSKGIYAIPYRCYLCRDIDNLFYAGRIISTTHVAFGSSRVMATCAHGAQAVGMAAALCIRHGLRPADLLEESWMSRLQNELNKNGQSIPGLPIRYGPADPNHDMRIRASSTATLDLIPFDGPWMSLEAGVGQLFPMQPSVPYTITIQVQAREKSVLQVQLQASQRLGNYTPDRLLESLEVPVEPGEHMLTLPFSVAVEQAQYGMLLLLPNPALSVRGSRWRHSGLVSVFNGTNKAVGNNGFQAPPPHAGVEAFPFWCPARRPGGPSIAWNVAPALAPYHADHLRNGFTRPYLGTNAWAADPRDPHPSLDISWAVPQTIGSITLFFDTDYDHPMESTLLGHPESRIPFCIQAYRILDGEGHILHETSDNHQTINRITLAPAVQTAALRIEVEHPDPFIPAALFEIIIA